MRSHVPPTDQTLLIVDDEPEICKLLQQIAAALCIRTRVATNGQEALRVLDRHPVTAILADVKMPNGDGKSLLQHLRQNGSTIPLAFLTADLSNDTLQEALSLGAYAFVTKPFQIENVESLMFRLMALGTRKTF